MVHVILIEKVDGEARAPTCQTLEKKNSIVIEKSKYVTLYN